MEDRAELNADKEQQKKLDEMADSNEIKRDYYLDEVLAIITDYVDLIRSAPATQAVQASPPAPARN